MLRQRLVGLSLALAGPHARVTRPTSVLRRWRSPGQPEGLGVKAELRQGDLFDALGRERFDVIACNPPYIPSGELPALQREVRFEPAPRLDGGADGLDFYRRIARSAPDHLAPGGAIFLEVGMRRPRRACPPQPTSPAQKLAP